MRRIVINMQNSLFCNAISETLRNSGNEFDTYTVDSPDKVIDDCNWIEPYALLMEVTGYVPWRLCERIKIRDAVKAQHPECKIVLIVDENAEKEVATVLRKKCCMQVECTQLRHFPNHLRKHAESYHDKALYASPGQKAQTHHQTYG